MIDYFYGKTELSSGFIADLWRFNASTGLGQFSGNSGSNSVFRTVSGNNFEDFSLYFTYKKQQSSFNSGAVSLFSNYSGGAGFTFGLDGCNFPFLKAGGEGFTFDAFDLGGKNVLCLQKAANAFSLTRYDIPSSGVFQSQTYFASPGISLSGGSYRFGATLDNISGLNNFYGTVDQLLFLNEKISENDSLTIFSGFSDLSVTEDIFGSYFVESQEWYIPNSGFSSALQTLFQDYFTGVYQDYVYDEALNPGEEYFGRITLSGISGGYETRNFYSPDSLGFCQSGGSFQMGYPDFMASGSGLSNNFEIKVNFTIGPLNPNISTYFPDEMYFTYDLSAIQPGLRYSDLLKFRRNESFVQSQNTGYYSGFEMKGILAPNSQLSLLGAFNSSFNNVGNEAVFDSVSGVFKVVNPVSGLPVYLNGLLETGVFVNSGTIDILNYTETSADEIIYDRYGLSSLFSENPQIIRPVFSANLTSILDGNQLIAGLESVSWNGNLYPWNGSFFEDDDSNEVDPTIPIGDNLVLNLSSGRVLNFGVPIFLTGQPVPFSLLSMSFGASSLGDFYAGTAFAATGLYSFETFYRLRKEEFYETHPYHLYHGKNWQETSAPQIYDNSTGNWI